MREPLLFERFPGLRGRVPWVSLGTFPTPVAPMEKLGGRMGLGKVWVKRDDLSGEVYGGNKVRKLEFALAEALDKKSGSVITLGAVGSNHVLATTLYCGRLGLKTIGVFTPQPVQHNLRANILCNCHQGCEIVYAGSMAAAAAAVARVYAREFVSRRRPYLLWIGGTNTAGTLGYVEGGLELARQVEDGLLPAPEYIFVPVGSAGTFAGLLAGLRLAGLDSTVVGVRVAGRVFANETVTAYLANRALAFLRSRDPSVPKVKIEAAEIVMLHDYYGSGYANYTTKGVEAMEMIAETEGIELEGTYSGKALAGMLDFMGPRARRNVPALFINTYNSRPIEPLLAECPGPQILPDEIQEYFTKDIAPVEK